MMMTESEPRSPDAPVAAPVAGASQNDEEPRQSSPQQSADLWKRIRSFFSSRRGGGSLRENLEDELARESDGDEAFSPEERLLLGNILRLRNLRVDDVMIPRADIEAVEAGTSLGRLMQIFQESGHSRMPVYEETLDDPRGMIHIKDLMSWVSEQSGSDVDDKDDAEDSDDTPGPGHNSHELDLSAVDLSTPLKEAGLVRQLLFVPPSMPATDLMAKMQAVRIQMALVIDEYGGTDGLVSLEDLVEEVVGDIEDEHDEDEEILLQPVSEGEWIADPRLMLEDFAKEIGVDVDKSETTDDVDTLGGLLYVTIGRVPVRGELLRVDDTPGYEYEILDADPRRIKKIRIRQRRLDARASEQQRRQVKKEETSEEKS